MWYFRPFLIIIAVAMWMAMPVSAQDIGERVDDVFSEWDSDDSPGCAVGVFDDGEIAYEAGYGIANLDHGIPITPETVFYIGSVSKHLTTASIALLHLRGDLDLDDNIREYVPEMPEYDEPITIRHLVHHTSGVRDIYALMSLKGVDPGDMLSEEDMMDLVTSQTSLNFEPGEEYLYSNAGYFLLSQIVERASGQSLREFSNEHIFEPLGMENTHFHDDWTHIVEGRAMSYQPDNDGFRQSYLGNFQGVGAGGLYTSIRDFLEWDRQMTEDRLGVPGFNELMLTRGVLADGDTLDYAFALSHGEYKGHDTIGHSGSFMGFRADYTRFPEANLSVATFCNLGSINPGSLSEKVADIFLEEAFEDYLSQYTGTFHNDDLDVTYPVTVQNGELYLDRDQSPSGSMSYSEEDTFNLSGWTVEFIRDNAGEIEAFEVDTGRARGVTFERQP